MSGLFHWLIPTPGDAIAVGVWVFGAGGLAWLWVTQRRLDREREDRRWRRHANRYHQ